MNNFNELNSVIGPIFAEKSLPLIHLHIVAGESSRQSVWQVKEQGSLPIRKLRYANSGLGASLIIDGNRIFACVKVHILLRDD